MVAACIAAFLMPPDRAFAIDCSRAISLQDKAICNDEGARQADQRLNAAFRHFRDSRPTEEWSRINRWEMNWLRRRSNACSESCEPKFSTCIARQLDYRARYLLGQPVSGPEMSSAIEPVFIFESDGSDRVIDASLLHFAHPQLKGEFAFNEWVEAVQKEIPDGKGEPVLFLLEMELTHLSADFLSARVESYLAKAGAPGVSRPRSVNIRMADGAVLSYRDVLDEARAGTAVESECLAQVQEQVCAKRHEFEAVAAQCVAATELQGCTKRYPSERLQGEELQRVKAALAGELQRFGNWSFSNDGARIVFAPTVIGSYADGAFECRLPRTLLSPAVRSDFKLP
jgi:uncharacterized protein YecT (DUF1311 family)